MKITWEELRKIFESTVKYWNRIKFNQNGEEINDPEYTFKNENAPFRYMALITTKGGKLSQDQHSTFTKALMPNEFAKQM